jgi:hypothetical protein
MQETIAYKGLQALQATSANSIKISELAQQDNQVLLGLAKKSQKDAKTLNTITILGMIYLPASFVSVGQHPWSSSKEIS